MPEIELLLDCRATIGESPTWSAPEQTLYWIDVKGPTLHRLSASGLQAQWRLEADIGAFALLEGAGGALVALRNGIFRLDFATREPSFSPRLRSTRICFASTRASVTTRGASGLA